MPTSLLHRNVCKTLEIKYYKRFTMLSGGINSKTFLTCIINWQLKSLKRERNKFVGRRINRLLIGRRFLCNPNKQSRKQRIKND